MTLVLSVLEQGMIYAIMALGIYITYTILDFPDLTVDGSFPLGAALSAVLISKGMNPVLTLVIAFDSCKIKSPGSAVRYYYDDSSLYGKSSDCRTRKPSDL